MDDADPVGELVGLVQILRGQEHGGAGADQVADQVPDLEAAARIDAGGRLVQEQHVGPAHQRRGQVQAPLHAARIGAHQPVGVGRQRDPLQHLRGAFARDASAQVVQPAYHLDGLPAGQVLVHRRELAGKADAGADRDRIAHDVDAGDRGRAAVGLEQRGQHADQRGLAGAVRPQQGVDDAGLDLQADAGQRLDGAESLLDPVGAHDRLHRMDRAQRTAAGSRRTNQPLPASFSGGRGGCRS